MSSYDIETANDSNQTLSSGRGVDAAMADERLAKQTIRGLWLKHAKFYDQLFPNDDVPLYLTLSGEEARDIKLLAANQIITLTEIGGIAAKSQNRVVAIERNPKAVLRLQRLLPGLKILQQDFKGVVAGDTLTRFPQGEQEKYCCAKIINLDFQDALQAIETSGAVTFPVFSWVRKISILHTTKKPQLEWSLFLTLNSTLASTQPDGQIMWSQQVSKEIQAFLTENFRNTPDFEVSCRLLLGEILHEAILASEPLDLGTLSTEQQQKLLMVFVPKKIARLVHDQNWQLKTLWNLRYGGNSSQAPMVTWLFSFHWDARASSMPEAVYKDSLKHILRSAGYVEDDGQLQIADLG